MTRIRETDGDAEGNDADSASVGALNLAHTIGTINELHYKTGRTMAKKSHLLRGPLLPNSSIAIELTLAVLFAGISVVTLVGWGAIRTSYGLFTFDPIAALVTIGSVVVGPAAVGGLVVGQIGYLAIQGIVPVWESVGYVVLGGFVQLLWRRTGTTPQSAPDGTRPRRRVREFAFVAAVAALGAATVTSWGYEVTGAYPFFPTVVVVGAGLFGSVGVGVGILAVVRRLADKERWRSTVEAFGPQRRVLPEGDGLPIRFTVAVLALWVLLGSIVGVWFQVVGLVPPFHFRVRNLSHLLLFKEPGPFEGGTVLQMVLGTTLLTLWTLALRQQRLSADGEG